MGYIGSQSYGVPFVDVLHGRWWILKRDWNEKKTEKSNIFSMNDQQYEEIIQKENLKVYWSDPGLLQNKSFQGGIAH